MSSRHRRRAGSVLLMLGTCSKGASIPCQMASSTWHKLRWNSSCLETSWFWQKKGSEERDRLGFWVHPWEGRNDSLVQRDSLLQCDWDGDIPSDTTSSQQPSQGLAQEETAGKGGMLQYRVWEFLLHGELQIFLQSLRCFKMSSVDLLLDTTRTAMFYRASANSSGLPCYLWSSTELNCSASCYQIFKN